MYIYIYVYICCCIALPVMYTKGRHPQAHSWPKVEKKSAAGAACCEGATDIGSGARESPGSQWPFLGRLAP